MLRYLVASYVVLPWIVALDIHDDQILLIVAAENNSSGSSSAGLGLEDLEFGFEEIVEKGTFAAILSSDDGDSEILLFAIFETA